MERCSWKNNVGFDNATYLSEKEQQIEIGSVL